MKTIPVRCKCGRAWVDEWSAKCERCQREDARHQERARPKAFVSDAKTTERGYDAAWQRERERLLARAPFCVACLCRDRVTVLAQSVDHIVPFHAVGESEREAYRLGQWNLEGICNRHHDGIKRWHESRHHWTKLRSSWVAWLTERPLTAEARTLLGVLGLDKSEDDARRQMERMEA